MLNFMLIALGVLWAFAGPWPVAIILLAVIAVNSMRNHDGT